MAKVQNVVSTKLPPEVLERLGAVADALSARPPSVPVTRSAVVRLAIERGLPELEREAGIKPAKGRRKRQK